MKIEALTPVLVVEAIEPQLSLWVDQLHFTKVDEVEHEGRLGFVILVQGATTVMLQTLASCQADHEGIARDLRVGDVLLYTRVDSLDEAERASEGLEQIVPRRRTFYGADEIFVRTTDGHRVAFSVHGS